MARRHLVIVGGGTAGWGRSHDAKNLFIVYGSIFVTSGAVNPTSTTQALALFIGDRIKANIGNFFD